MPNEFYELIPARSPIQKASASSPDFIKYLTDFLSTNNAIDDFSLSATASNIRVDLENKKLSEMRKSHFDSFISLFFSLITDRGLLFQQTRERSELIDERRSLRNLSMHRNGVTKHDLEKYGPTRYLVRQSALQFVFEKYRDERLHIARSILKNCDDSNQKLDQFEDILDNFLDPIKPVLREIIQHCVEQYRKVDQLYGKFFEELRVTNNSTRKKELITSISSYSKLISTLDPKQLDFLVTVVLPNYIKEERRVEELKLERLQPGKLSFNLGELQALQFQTSLFNCNQLQQQWNAAFSVLTGVYNTYAETNFHLELIPRTKLSKRSVLPSDFSPYLEYAPLEQLIINYRYHSAISKETVDEGVKSILDNPSSLGESTWHSWRAARRNAVLVKELVALLKKKEIDPESAEGLAQIDALLFFTGFASYVLQHPKSLDAFVHALTIADEDNQIEPLSSILVEKFLICRILTEIRMCVDYTITDCLCFDPTLFLQVECPPSDSDDTISAVNTNIPAYEKLLRWVNHPAVSLSGLKRMKITDESFKQYRQLFEEPATSRDTMRKFLLPICDEFNWDYIHFPPLKKFINRPIYYNKICLLLTEYAFLMKLTDETRTELIRICKILIDFTAGNAL